jgi:integrase
MHPQQYFDEFRIDWQLAGRSTITACSYVGHLRRLDAAANGDITLAAVKRWLAESASAETARARARAVRAFGKWAEANDGPPWTWWREVPLTAVQPRPQATVSEAEYRRVPTTTRSSRDRLVIELLWSTGLRVSELSRVNVEHVDLVGGFIVIPRAKAGRPRVVPLSESARRACRRFVGNCETGPLLGMTAHGIQLLLRRLGAPSAHAWRRGWAVHALRSGVSEASLRAAAGWSGGAMVVRYTSALSGELAIHEFRARWGTAT